jgi:hypothetical protein
MYGNGNRIAVGILMLIMTLNLSLCSSENSGNGTIDGKSGSQATAPTIKEVISLAFGNSVHAKGDSSFLLGRSVQGAVILTDKLPDNHHSEYNRSLHKIAARVAIYQQLQKQVPFEITRWGGIYSAPCPTMPRAHVAERGLMWAHYRIWRDFAFIDPILEARYEKWRIQNVPKVVGDKTGESPSELGGTNHSARHHFKASGNGLYHIQRDYIVSQDHTYKISLADGKRFRGDEHLQNDDIILIFEDDAVPTVKDLPETLREELRDLHSGFASAQPYSYYNFNGNLPGTPYFDPKAKDQDIYGGSNPHDETKDGSMDIVYLGWCEGRLAKPAPICSHAYAITRFAARKLVHYIEPCGEALDLQLATLIKNGWVRFRRANSWSYSQDKIRPDYSEAGNGGGFKDFGIFRQCKSHCGSFMYHRK